MDGIAPHQRNAVAMTGRLDLFQLYPNEAPLSGYRQPFLPLVSSGLVIMPMNSMLAYRLKRISRNLFAAVLITLLSIYTILPLFIYGGVEFPLTDIQLSSSDVSNEESNSANDPMSSKLLLKS